MQGCRDDHWLVLPAQSILCIRWAARPASALLLRWTRSAGRRRRNYGHTLLAGEWSRVTAQRHHSTSQWTSAPHWGRVSPKPGQPDHIWRRWCCPKRCENRTSGASLEWIPALCPWCNAGSVNNSFRASLARLALLPHLLDHFRPRSLRNSILLALAWECRTTQTYNAKVCLVWVRKTVAFSLPW